jgi:hypothetical protein
MEAKTLTAIAAEHTLQVQELTQRIGDLCQQVNDRDRTIDLLKQQRLTLLDSNERIAQLLNQLLMAARGYALCRRNNVGVYTAWTELLDAVDVMAHIETTNPKGTK